MCVCEREREGEGDLKETVCRNFHRICAPQRIFYYLPILSWIPRYSYKDLPADVIAGLAVAMLLVPQGDE